MKEKRAGFTVGAMICATVVSKLLGMLRQIMLAKRLGGGVYAVAFSAASKIPLSVFDILLSAAIVACFVPFYSDKLRRDEKDARLFSSSFFTLTLLTSTVIAVLGAAFSRQILSVCAPNLTEEAAVLGAKLLSVMFPMIIFTGAAYVLVGIMQSRGSFILPALVSSVSNLAMIIYLAAAKNAESEKSMLVLSAIYVGSWALQFVTLAVPLAIKKQFPKPTLRIRGKGLSPALKMVPSVMAGAWLLPACSLLLTFFATFVSDSAVAEFDYSSAIWLMASGVLTYGVCNFILPSLSRIFSGGDEREFSSRLTKAVTAAFALSLPVSVGLYLLSDNIVCMLYLRGNFGAESAVSCGEILRYLAFSVPFFCVYEVLSRGFFARKSAVPPMIASLVGIGAFAICGAVFVFGFDGGARGLAIAYGIAYVAASLTLFIFTATKIRGFFGKALLLPTAEIMASGALGAVFASFLRRFFEKNAVNLSVFQNFLVCAIVFSGECVVYLICISIWRGITRNKSKEV